MMRPNYRIHRLSAWNSLRLRMFLPYLIRLLGYCLFIQWSHGDHERSRKHLSIWVQIQLYCVLAAIIDFWRFVARLLRAIITYRRPIDCSPTWSLWRSAGLSYIWIAGAILLCQLWWFDYPVLFYSAGSGYALRRSATGKFNTDARQTDQIPRVAHTADGAHCSFAGMILLYHEWMQKNAEQIPIFAGRRSWLAELSDGKRCADAQFKDQIAKLEERMTGRTLLLLSVARGSFRYLCFHILSE